MKRNLQTFENKFSNVYKLHFIKNILYVGRRGLQEVRGAGHSEHSVRPGGLRQCFYSILIL